MKKKIIIGVAVWASISMLTIIGWEQIDQDLATWYAGEPIVYERQEQTPPTIDGLIEQRAQSWLKSPEALEYAKKQVTSSIIDELSKH